MRRLFLAIVAMLITGCAGVPMPDYRAARAAAEAQVTPALPDSVCWWFGGKVYCPPADGSQLVLPCDTPSAVYEVPYPVLPKPSVVPTAHVVGVITATDTAGKPAAAAEVCSQYGCTGVKSPAPVVVYERYYPPVAVYVQPPPKRCPKIIIWGPQVGYGPWGLPTGAPLHRH